MESCCHILCEDKQLLQLSINLTENKLSVQKFLIVKVLLFGSILDTCFTNAKSSKKFACFDYVLIIFLFCNKRLTFCYR